MDHQKNVFSLLDGFDVDESVIVDRVKAAKREAARLAAIKEAAERTKAERLAKAEKYYGSDYTREGPNKNWAANGNGKFLENNKSNGYQGYRNDGYQGNYRRENGYQGDRRGNDNVNQGNYARGDGYQNGEGKSYQENYIGRDNYGVEVDSYQNGDGRGYYYRRNYGGGRGGGGRQYGQGNYRRSEAVEGNDQTERNSEDKSSSEIDAKNQPSEITESKASDGGSVVSEVSSEAKPTKQKKHNGIVWKPWSQMSEEESNAERARKAEKRAKEIEEDKKLMTLKQYEEKILREKEEKKKEALEELEALEASVASGERKVNADKDFEAMKPIYKKQDSSIEEKYLLQEKQPKKNSQGGGKDDKKYVKKNIIKEVFQSPGGRRFERRGGSQGSEVVRFDRRNMQNSNNTGGQARVNGRTFESRRGVVEGSEDGRFDRPNRQIFNNTGGQARVNGALSGKVKIEDESQFPSLLGA